MSRRAAILAAAGGSLALLLVAWGFQYLGGLQPCQLCLWQRWPHLLAVPIGILALGVVGPTLPLAGAVAATATAALGAWHAGVEAGWLPGPAACAGDAAALDGLDGEALLSTEAPAALVRCSEVAWSFAGISMAGWNALLSLALAGFWAWAAWRSRGGPALRAETLGNR